MSEFTMVDYSDEDVEKMFDGLEDYIENTADKDNRPCSMKDMSQDWKDLYLRIGIRMAIRCKQKIWNVPIAMYNAEGSASVLWNGYREE